MYHTDSSWAALASGCVFLVFDGPMHDASSDSKIRLWFLLNVRGSVRMRRSSAYYSFSEWNLLYMNYTVS